MDHWNTTFKKPAGFPLQRLTSPSPPRAHVEPLSPTKPKPIEPQFNYLPVDSTLTYTVHPDQAFIATPARATGGTQTSRHNRTPSSNIDTLAEAALALSPSGISHSQKRSATYQHNGFVQTHTPNAAYGASEPPHKRARSELLPSPLVGTYASRPATSYAHNQNRPYHGNQPTGHGYDSRVEEAALLLNFRTGGWPSGNGMSPPQPPPPAAHRPHANSFPRDAYHHRPTEASAHAPLLPPFSLLDAPQPPATLPSPQQTVDDSDPSPQVAAEDKEPEDVLMTDAGQPTNPKAGAAIQKAPMQTQTPPDESVSRAESTDVAPSEVSETAKSRRGGAKGKARAANSKRTIAAATKRAATRRKTPDTAKSTKMVSHDLVGRDAKDSEPSQRRKSLSDAPSSHPEPTTATRAQSVPPEVRMFIREASPFKPGSRHAKVTSDTVCAGCSTLRQKTTASSEMDEWISCNGCRKWLHIDCAGFKKAHEIRDVDKYFCTACEPQHGKTTFVRKSARAHASVDYAELQRGVLKTSEESVEHHYIQPIKDGTLFPFDQESFPRMRPEMVTRDFFERSGTFIEPICIPAEWNPRPWNERAGKSADYERAAAAGQEPVAATADLLPQDFEYDSVQDDGQDKLDMVMPQGLTVRQVCNLVGPETPLDVIDVKTQNSGAKWNLGRWADYYEEDGDEKAIRNVISLEVSQTKLGRLLRRPQIVRDIDLQDQVWPQEETDRGKYPKVQYYCLMSVADSYTDFHIDFGGSSVYYHILKGKKTFFFIPPKPKHLKAYEEWNESPQQNYTFLPDITKECYRVDLSEGDTMLIPSGWIHAVWTPATSLVIGGNFLTRISYKNQFKVVEIEKANRTPMKFRYPFFQRIMWYTALQYLQTDPLPPAVSELFYEGKQFSRQTPIWQDFDGTIAANDPRPEAHNARYYSQAELDGLPDLVNYIFKTVMIVLGLSEGTSADQMKRVNASIPKGHGEPLEVAKTFAMWVAWKRGREGVPAWAHPDALLNNIKEEGPPKKLSARAIKDLERKEAIAAWKIAPDRQSERMMTKQATAVTTDGATQSPAPPPSQQPPPSQHHQSQTLPHQPHQSPPTSMAPTAFIIAPTPSHYLSTPKTSVLGPKRVACDACRKRRIKCKHKDLVTQTSPNQFQQFNGVGHDGSFQSNLAPELHDNITVTPPKHRPQYVANGMEGTSDGAYAQSNGFHPDETSAGSGNPHVNGHGPMPGTNAYVNANIPMTMNGVPIFGEVPKRGRSKACYECRKSKRRCVHDENGNVDPAKAAETPVPRGSATSKKHSMGEDGSPSEAKKPKASTSIQQPPRTQAGTIGVLMPHHVSLDPAPQTPVRPPNRQAPPTINEPPQDPQQQPEIDPSLFSVYPEPSEQGPYANSSYPYPTTEQAQPNPYEFPSLEQIANEVLDMNGRGHEDFIDAQLNALHHQPHNPHEMVHVYEAHDTAPLPDGLSKPDESVDSAISLPGTEALNQQERPVDDRLRDAMAADAAASHHGTDRVQQAVGNSHTTNGIPMSRSLETQQKPPSDWKPDVSSLPLYRPPAPLSQSPEQSKRQPAALINGVMDGTHKRKRDSIPATPGSKKARGGDYEDRMSREPSVRETEDERIAKLLQQEELGLRRRSK